MWLSAGTKLGRYEILAALGAGGMGEVYRAHDTRLERDVAVKILSPHLAGDPAARASFAQEAQLAAALSHPNVVAVHDVGTEGESLYVVTELLAGETLRNRLAGGPIPWPQAFEIARGILEGLVAGHAKNIVHRDLKPDNVFLTLEGVPKILDFGLAQRLRAERTELAATEFQTGAGIMAGTLGYLSPEQIAGRTVDARADLFAYGCVLYEMVSGRRAFDGRSMAEVIAAILETSPPALSAPGVPGAVAQLVGRCLEKDPTRRYPSSREALKALAATVSRGMPLSPLEALRSAPSVAVLPFANITQDPSQDYFCDGIAEELIHALGRLEGVRVAARSSTFNARHRDEDAQTLADRLNVGTILRGSVRKAGNRVRVTVQLENGTDGYQMWSERWDRELTDIFEIQDDIAKGVVEKLKVTLVAEPGAAIVLPATNDLEAYELYLRGRYQWNRRTPAALQEAVASFQRAIDRDPSYALAHAGLADSLALLNLYTGVPQRQLHARALAAALRAVELNGELPETHTSLAFIKEHAEWAWSEAHRHFTRALALNPKYSTAHHWFALFLAARGRHDEAFHHIRIAMELEPFSPGIQTSAGRILYVARRFDAALDQYRRAQGLDAVFQPPWREIALPFLAKREAGAAKQALEHALELLPSDDFALGHLSMAYAQAGAREEAQQVLARLQNLSTPERSLSYQLAIAHLACGAPDEALRWLRIACEERIHWTVLLAVDPIFDGIRDTAPFRSLLQMMGLDRQDR